jgi:hypothetical protein
MVPLAAVSAYVSGMWFFAPAVELKLPFLFFLQGKARYSCRRKEELLQSSLSLSSLSLSLSPLSLSLATYSTLLGSSSYERERERKRERERERRGNNGS